MGALFRNVFFPDFFPGFAGILAGELGRAGFFFAAASLFFFLAEAVSFACFSASRLRRRSSSAEYMEPRHFLAPQLQGASSSPPSYRQ
jgi:hypothetical protein